MDRTCDPCRVKAKQGNSQGGLPSEIHSDGWLWREGKRYRMHRNCTGMSRDYRSFGRTGPAVPQSCGCNVLPWETCEHSPLAPHKRDSTHLAPHIAPNVRHKPSTALRVALAFHEAYERLAPLNGYETRKETRHFDPNTANGRTMLAVVTELLNTGIIEVAQW